MKILALVLIITAWLATGLLSAGLGNAAFRVSFPRTADRWTDKERIRLARRDCTFAITVGLIGGPFSLPSPFIMSGAGADGWTLSCEPVARN